MNLDCFVIDYSEDVYGNLTWVKARGSEFYRRFDGRWYRHDTKEFLKDVRMSNDGKTLTFVAEADDMHVCWVSNGDSYWGVGGIMTGMDGMGHPIGPTGDPLDPNPPVSLVQALWDLYSAYQSGEEHHHNDLM